MTIAALAKELARFSSLEGATWREAVGAAVAALIAEGTLDAERRVVDQQALGVRLETTIDYRWPRLIDWVFPALALGISPTSDNRRRLGDRDAWSAAIAGRALGLWREGAPPSAATLCDHLAWQRLDLPGKPKRLPDEVRAVFLQRELGTTPAPANRLLRLLAARELGVTQTELRALRNALVQRWLERGPMEGAIPNQITDAESDARSISGSGSGSGSGSDSGSDSDSDSDSGSVSPRDPAPISFLASLTDALAEIGPDGRFGDRKVFISAAWAQLVRSDSWHHMSLAEFKTRLLQALSAGELVLARADLVGAMDPHLVERSETSSDAGATFHFIVGKDV